MSRSVVVVGGGTMGAGTSSNSAHRTTIQESVV